MIQVKTTIISILLLLLMASKIYANEQDSLSLKALGLKVNSGFYYGPTPQDADEVAILQHGVAYYRLIPYIKFDGFTAEFDLTAEHRSQSAGVFSDEAIYVYPRYNFTLDSNVMIFGIPANYKVSIGNFFDRRPLQGLTFLNIDDQGWYADFNYLGFGVRYDKIADFFLNIGHNADDVNIFQAYYLGDFFDNFLNLKYAFAVVDHVPPNSDSYDLVGRFRNDHSFEASIKDYAKLSFQYSVREDLSQSQFEAIPVGDRNAFIFGVESLKEFKILGIDLSSAFFYRRYGSLFNNQFYSEEIVDLSWNSRRSNGFYPSYYLDRNFAQWGAYAEHQEEVSSWNLILNLNYDLPFKARLLKNMSVFVLSDFNSLSFVNSEDVNFNFIEFGLRYQPYDAVEFNFYSTNKIYDDKKSYFAFREQVNRTFRFTLRLNLDQALYQK